MATTIEKLQKNYASAGGRNASAIPWAVLIELLLSLFGDGCTPKRAKRFARMFPGPTKKLLDDQLKEDGMFVSAKDRKAAVEAAYRTFINMPDEEIENR